MDEEAPAPLTFQPDIYEKILPFLPQNPSCQVLDVGAGQGYLSRLLKDYGYHVEACDFSRSNFRCADIPFAEADLNTRMPYTDNRFDCTVSVEVVEHIENHFSFLSEMMRVTKPGGTLVITTPNVVSITSRWHFFKYGYTDCAPIPLDPAKEDYFMQHINPISLPELLFHIERFGGKLTALATNRWRRSSLVPFIILYPFFALALRRKLLRKKHRDAKDLHLRHIHWMLSPASLLGRITIAVARKN